MTPDVPWRHEHDYVRRVPGHDLYVVRDYGSVYGGDAEITARDSAGTIFGTIFARGDRWVAYDRTEEAIGLGTSQSHAALIARQHYWNTMGAAAADEDPAVALRRWEQERPRSSKTANAAAIGKLGVGPSDLTACAKAVEYRERPPEDHELVEVPKDAAIIGILLHEALTSSRKGQYPWRQFGRKIPVIGLDSDGECDEFDPIIGRVVDYKTASSYKWDVIGRSGPPNGEWGQVQVYGRGLTDEGEKVESVQLLYMNRETGETEVFTRPYDGAFAAEALGKLHAMMDALEAGDPLPRERDGDELLGPTVNTLCARYCPHVKTCWNLDEVPEGRTPEGYLLVQPDDDGAIAATLSLYDEERTTESEAKKRKAYARTLLEGLEAGQYAEMLLSWSGGKTTDKDDPEKRIEQLETAMRFAIETDTPPPDPDELPYPTTPKTSAVSIGVKKVRASQREVS